MVPVSEQVVISYIVAVFNKEPYIGVTTDSLLQQEGGIPSEYIFVDDVSSDRSLDVVEAHARGRQNVRIVRNTSNAGPSVRYNQGAELARGTYLQFMDSDDVLAANASALMLKLATEHRADLVHGAWLYTHAESATLLGKRAPENARVRVSHKPFELVFTEKLRRMSQLVRRDTYLAAGGCDDRVFVPDESLPLRVARVAKCFVYVNAPVLLVPRVEGALSGNTSQLNHDRFMSYYNLITDYPDLDEHVRRLCFERCISSAWKQQRDELGALGAMMRPVFRDYLISGFGLRPVDAAKLEMLHRYFAALEGLRRGQAEPAAGKP